MSSEPAGPARRQGRPTRAQAREFSAGGVVVRGDEVVVIVPTRRAADGSRVLALPKGHVDPGETPVAGRRARGARGDGDRRRAGQRARRDALLVPPRRAHDRQVGLVLPVRATSAATSPTTTTRSRRSAGSALEEAAARAQPRRPSARWSRWRAPTCERRPVACRAMQVLNFYSTIFADELKRGRKTATIRLGDKSGKYRKNQAVLVTIGYQYSPRETDLRSGDRPGRGDASSPSSRPRDIKHDNPEFRRHEELINFLEQIYGRAVSPEDTVTVVRFSQILDNAAGYDRGDQGLRRRPELAGAAASSARRGRANTPCGVRQSHTRVPIALVRAPDLLYIEVGRWHSPPESAKEGGSVPPTAAASRQ